MPFFRPSHQGTEALKQLEESSGRETLAVKVGFFSWDQHGSTEKNHTELCHEVTGTKQQVKVEAVPPKIINGTEWRACAEPTSYEPKPVIIDPNRSSDHQPKHGPIFLQMKGWKRPHQTVMWRPGQGAINEICRNHTMVAGHWVQSTVKKYHLSRFFGQIKSKTLKQYLMLFILTLGFHPNRY